MEEMSQYWTDVAIQEKWNTLHRTYRCCGLYNLVTGYLDWENNQATGQQHGVPDTCCLTEAVGCGDRVSIFSEQHPHQNIFIHGCLAVMKIKYHRDLSPLLWAYSTSTLVVCLVSIIALVLGVGIMVGEDKYITTQDKNITTQDKNITTQDKYITTQDKKIPTMDMVNTTQDKIINTQDKYMEYEDEQSLKRSDEDRSTVYIVPTRVGGTVV